MDIIVLNSIHCKLSGEYVYVNCVFFERAALHLPKIRFPSGLSRPASRPRVVSWARGFPVRTGGMGIPRDKLAEGQSQSLPLYTGPLLYFQSSDICI